MGVGRKAIYHVFRGTQPKSYRVGVTRPKIEGGTTAAEPTFGTSAGGVLRVAGDLFEKAGSASLVGSTIGPGACGQATSGEIPVKANFGPPATILLGEVRFAS